MDAPMEEGLLVTTLSVSLSEGKGSPYGFDLLALLPKEGLT